MDERIINKFKVPDNENLKDYAMNPIYKGSLLIKNGVMYVLGGVSSGKSTLLSKLIGVYHKTLNCIINCFYTGLTADETTQYALSSFNIHNNVHFIRLPTPEAMISFFNQYRYKRLKLAELLMFLQSVFKNNNLLIVASVEMINELGLNNEDDVNVSRLFNRKINIMTEYINKLINDKRININDNKHYIYSSEYLTKIYSKKHNVDFTDSPTLFIINALISFSKGFKECNIIIDTINNRMIKPSKADLVNGRFINVKFEPFIRLVMNKLELVPTISVFDDVASFPLLTAERSNQWIKDLFAETRRWMNTFIIAAQRHNLLNKTLRSLTHTFFVGYSLVDDDIPRIAKEIPSNLLSSEEFKLLYNNIIKPFTFFVYNNKLGYNVIKLTN